jgi:hypothetical protein
MTQVTLSKLDDTLVVVTKLNTDAQRMMADEVVARGQVSHLVLLFL